MARGDIADVYHDEGEYAGLPLRIKNASSAHKKFEKAWPGLSATKSGGGLAVYPGFRVAQSALLAASAAAQSITMPPST
jgi:hypothetical protein